ncbi:hypothetical protein EOD42_22320 [Rhodovarius crocodyli]|uniref:MarR family transcriptional regulator n=1 Tax=Rhodovarius crocodyli TaxID=1979269 RepID=A0A437M1H5_9PROT|nr:hypothetical protein [Rhodovarius crocodyli]RVT91393.1 hypothetical protein EOD42_22320 [Rhodovarius crocodyli]
MSAPLARGGMSRLPPNRPTDGQILAALGSTGARAWRIANRFGEEITPRYIRVRLNAMEKRGLVTRGVSKVVPTDIHWMRAVADTPKEGAA